MLHDVKLLSGLCAVILLAGCMPSGEPTLDDRRPIDAAPNPPPTERPPTDPPTDPKSAPVVFPPEKK